MPDTQRLEPKAPINIVRMVGAFFLLLGGIQIYFGAGWYIDGFPERWFGAIVMAIGTLMEIVPQLFQRRVGRVCQMADQLSKGRTSNS